jgi:hypothetical protein
MAIYISVTNQQLSAESDFIKYEIAGTFTLLACLISFWHVWGHLRHLGKIFSLFGLMFNSSETISSTTRSGNFIDGSNLLNYKLALLGLSIE